MALNQNQFLQSAVQGMMDMLRSSKVVSCIVDSTSAGLIAGQPVKIMDSAGGVPRVVESAANTDVSMGFVAYNNKKNSYVAGDSVEIATGFDDVIYLTAGAAIARGAKLMIQVSGVKVVTATSGKQIIGWAFDKAAADGDLIRVSLACPAFFVA